MSLNINKLSIGIVGLGYVGLPLAVEFGKKYPTVGFDIDVARVAELREGSDSTLECSSEELAEATQLRYESTTDAIADCNFYVVTVPTPIGDSNRPLLTPLRAASET
ncbi:MAG: Vi polysaccharide biosynthesis UDP-N-acetylglucosamine C-6 dehydrogenase TviB, partial [Woeseiaceae bacterium]|nr:Vi polysaccharide biosynthesis UDP-N-acetylglucosamine C-6 dehydrogenase TviB [Woeseiaceae bacterium]